MTEIATTNQAALAPIVSAEVSPGLWHSLTRPSPFFEAVAAMKADPAVVAELRARLPVLAEHAKPCGQRAVIATLAPLLTVYGVADKSEAEWKTFWSLYAEQLSDEPLEALKAGVADYMRRPDSEFFPKPGPLLGYVQKHSAPIFIAYRRAKRVAEEAR
jgi:hypothetical protein